MAEPGEVQNVVCFCRHVGEHFWDRIGFFDARTKAMLKTSGILRNEPFVLAADQIEEHGRVWRIQQRRHPERLTLEFPLVVEKDNYLRYVKFQIPGRIAELRSLNKVKRVWLDFHVSDQNLKVVYE